MPKPPAHKPPATKETPSPAPLRSSEEFQVALGLAKALAISCNCSELSPRLLLAGIFLAAEQAGKPQDATGELLPPGTEELVRNLLPKSDAPIAPVTGKKFPTNAALQAIFKENPESLRQLALRLYEVASAAVALEDELFLSFRRRATTCCLAAGEDSIGPEVFAAAAYAGFLDGDLVGQFALSVHLTTHSQALLALMQNRKWELGLLTKASVKPLPLEAGFESSLQEEDTGYCVINALRPGIDAGERILARRSTAIHEAGHAAASFLARPKALILGISIKPDHEYLGVTKFEPSPDASVSNAAQLSDELCVDLAGGIAEQIAYGLSDRSIGWWGDLEDATKTAWKAIADFGLDPQFGYVRLSTLTAVSGQTTGPLFDLAQERVRDVLNQAAARTEKLLRENWSLVESIAAALLEKEVLNTEDTMSLFLHRGLKDWPGVCKVRSKPVERAVRFATAPGVMDTPEGPVRYAAGDAIVTGEAGECWPISIAKFRVLYDPATGGTMGIDGLFHKMPRESLAYQLRETRTIVLNGGRGILTGNAGDWIVDQGDEDLFVVSALLFSNYYNVL